METIDFAEYEKQYFVTLRKPPGGKREFELKSLAESGGARDFVNAYAPMIKAQSHDVAATYFASWFGRVCAAFQYALWHDAAHIDLSLHNLALQFVDRPQGTALMFRLKNAEVSGISDAERAGRIAKYMELFYGGQVRPLLETVAQAGGVSVGMLWGMVATAMHYIRDVWVAQADSDERKARLSHDTDMLFYRLEPGIFGRKRNPFDIKFRMVENPKQPGSMMRLKASCCLAFKTDTGHGYCYTCPRLTDAERERMKTT
jgi:ferric iron reductase protein FhuF